MVTDIHVILRRTCELYHDCRIFIAQPMSNAERESSPPLVPTSTLPDVSTSRHHPTQHRSSLTAAQGALNPSSIGLTFVPQRQSSPLSSKIGTQARRRIRSFDTPDLISDRARSDISHLANVKSIASNRRESRQDTVDSKGKGPAQMGFDSRKDDYGEPGIFSDEYDMCSYLLILSNPIND